VSWRRDGTRLAASEEMITWSVVKKMTAKGETTDEVAAFPGSTVDGACAEAGPPAWFALRGLAPEGSEMHHARSRHPAPPRAPILVICAGGILGLVTVLASACNAVSGPRSVALALASGLTIGGGLLGQIAAALLPGLRIAWRRGFQHGLEAGLRAQAIPGQCRALAVVPPAIPAQPGAEAADNRPGQARSEASPPRERGRLSTPPQRQRGRGRDDRGPH
jgi:hypothetical protein